ncbi:hypothetical protein ABKA04_001378 [Annulohypoxylon sp. FPYF3050]
MATSIYQSSPLERMPLEILKNIICQLDDVRDMVNAIRACPQIWAAYKEFTTSEEPTKIATRVLFNRLDEFNVRGAALWAHKIRSWPQMDKADFKRTCQYAFNPPDEDNCPPLSFDSIACINKLHDTIDRVTGSYAINVVLPSFNRQPISRPARVTKPEAGRIMRAVYNLEMYFTCCRVQLMCPLPLDQEYISTGILPNLDHLLRKFAPWNVEQMVGVWEYLMLLVIPVFRQLEYEDLPPGWRFDGQLQFLASETAIVPKSYTTMRHPEMLLCQGLQRTEYYINQGIDIEERRDAWSNWTRPHEDRLFRTLYHHCETRFKRPRPISDLTIYGDHSAVLVRDINDMKYWATHVQPLFYSSDLDEGQFEVWKESYLYEVPQRAVYNFKHRSQWFHRSHGMYFWDKGRVDFVKAVMEDALRRDIFRLPFMALWHSG